jgi:hypothetical protein
VCWRVCGGAEVRNSGEERARLLGRAVEGLKVVGEHRVVSGQTERAASSSTLARRVGNPDAHVRAARDRDHVEVDDVFGEGVLRLARLSERARDPEQKTCIYVWLSRADMRQECHSRG